MFAGALAALLFVAAPAGAEIGDLEYQQCVTDINGDAGCSSGTPGSPLNGAAVTAPSPDGKSLYVSSSQETFGTLSRFSTTRSGRITFEQCLGNDNPSTVCDGPAAAFLGGLEDLAVSNDGRSVYGVSTWKDMLYRFAVAANGKMTFAECWANQNTGGLCTTVAGGILDVPSGLSLSANGRSLWVASYTSNAVLKVELASDGGFGDFACTSATGNGGVCSDAPADVVNGSVDIAADPTRGRAFVAAQDGVVTEINTNSGGSLSAGDCASKDGSDGVCETAVPGLDGPRPISVSPDGKSVYAGYISGGGLVEYDASGGGLEFESCVSPSGSGPCTNLAGDDGLVGLPFGMAISPDSRSVYMNSAIYNTFLGFGAAPGGQVSALQSCFGNDDDHGGLCELLPGEMTTANQGVSVSPNGRAVYMVGKRTVISFKREYLKPEVAIDRRPDAVTTTHRARAKVRYRFSSNLGSAAAFRCKLDNESFRRCAGREKFEVEPGRHRLKVVSTAYGNSSKPADDSFRVKRKGS